MKINKLHIRGFGKFNNFELNLSDGLNIIYGPNESGKSTLMAFIKAMFYGLKGGRAGRDGTAAPIKRHQPWNGSTYGGYIHFDLANQKSFRLDRAFDAGMTKLYDEQYNEVTALFSSGADGTGLAENLLGVNETVFEKTVFISQTGTRIDASSSRDLIDRISNIGQSGSEDISVKKAVAVLREALKQHVGTEKTYTRPLDVISRRIDELNLAREAAKLQKGRLANEKAMLSKISEDIARLEKKQKLFSGLMELARHKEKLETLERKSDENTFLNQSISQCETDIESMEKEKEDLEKGFVAVRPAPWLLAAGAGLAVAAGAYLFLKVNPWIIVPFGGAILLAGGLFYRKIRVSEQADNVLQQQISHLTDRIIRTRNQQEELKKRLDALSAGFHKEDLHQLESQIDILSDRANELGKATEIGLSPIEKNVMEGILDKYSEKLAQQIAAVNSSIAAQLTGKKLEEARLQGRTNAEDQGTEEHILEEELERLTQQKKLLEQKGEALTIAICTLEEAGGYVQNKYVPVMNKVFNNIFKGITNEKYLDVRAGDNLNIMLNDLATEQVVPVSVLSSGTIDQLYLALRMAVSETVLKANEKLPLMMDEPFAQYDDERTHNSLRYIYEISRQQQVVLFTCKEQEVGLISSKYPCKICSLTDA